MINLPTLFSNSPMDIPLAKNICNFIQSSCTQGRISSSISIFSRTKYLSISIYFVVSCTQTIVNLSTRTYTLIVFCFSVSLSYLLKGQYPMVDLFLSIKRAQNILKSFPLSVLYRTAPNWIFLHVTQHSIGCLHVNVWEACIN